MKTKIVKFVSLAVSILAAVVAIAWLYFVMNYECAVRSYGNPTPDIYQACLYPSYTISYISGAISVLFFTLFLRLKNNV